MRFIREGWPAKDRTNVDDPAEKFRKIADFLCTYHGSLLYGLRAVILGKVLSLLHQGHFGIQKMKQLAVPMYSSNTVGISEDDDQSFRVGICPLRLSIHLGDGYCTHVYVRCVSRILSSERDYSSDGCPISSRYKRSGERLAQTFKQSLCKSDKAPRETLFEFLVQHRQTPTGSGYSPSDLLNSRQIRTK